MDNFRKWIIVLAVACLCVGGALTILSASSDNDARTPSKITMGKVNAPAQVLPPKTVPPAGANLGPTLNTQLIENEGQVSLVSFVNGAPVTRNFTSMEEMHAMAMAPFATCDVPPPHDCFTTGDPGCDWYECCESVCSYDSYCCYYYWDSICVGEANGDPNCYIPPIPTGACCTCYAAPFNCVITEEEICNSWGMCYQGDDTTCFATDVYSSEPWAPITDYNYTYDTITVPDSFIIVDVMVQLDIQHTWIGDIDVRVYHDPEMQEIWDQRCGSWDNIRATASDDGEETLCSVVAAGPSNQVFYDPSVAALGPLSVFDGMDAAGDWTLEIYDYYGGDSGTLEKWALVFPNPDEATCIEGDCCPPWCEGSGNGGNGDEDEDAD